MSVSLSGRISPRSPRQRCRRFKLGSGGGVSRFKLHYRHVTRILQAIAMPYRGSPALRRCRPVACLPTGGQYTSAGPRKDRGGVRPELFRLEWLAELTWDGEGFETSPKSRHPMLSARGGGSCCDASETSSTRRRNAVSSILGKTGATLGTVRGPCALRRRCRSTVSEQLRSDTTPAPRRTIQKSPDYRRDKPN